MAQEERKFAMETYEPDAVIIREGEACGSLYRVLSGFVVLYLHYGMEDEHVIGISSSPKCFGEWSIFTGEPSRYTVVAYDRVLVERIRSDALEEFVRCNPQNAIEIMKSMAESQALTQKNIELLLTDLYERDEQRQRSKEELKRKIMQYRVGGLREML